MAHVTFIHGIANKPAPDVLLRIWRDSLARDDGLDLGAEGVSSSMVYWADVMYEEPQPEMAEHEANDSVVTRAGPGVEMAWRAELSGDAKAWTDQLASRLDFEAQPPAGDEEFEPPEDEMVRLESATFERIPLPWWLKRRLMETLLRDVHHYLFNSESTPRAGETYRVRDVIRKRLIGALAEGAARPGPHVVVSHSMGTVIAYDCLKRAPECPRVDSLMTIGSPLGLDEVQDKLKPDWTRDEGYPGDKVAGGWTNVYDRLDPVAGFDPDLANDFRRGGSPAVDDINEQNYGRWRHNVSKYLEGEKLRAALGRFLEL